MIIELERQRAPVVVIAHQVIVQTLFIVYCLKPLALVFEEFVDNPLDHVELSDLSMSSPYNWLVLMQAVLRALYAYFADRPLKEIPQIEV